MTDQAREAAREICMRHELYQFHDANQPMEDAVAAVTEAYSAGLSAGREQQWISVEDRLPEIGQEVLVFCSESREKGGGMFVDERKNITDERGRWDGTIWDAVDGNQLTITHWQPLPPPPAGATQPEVK